MPPQAPASPAPASPAPARALSWVEPERLGTGPVEASFGNEFDTLITRPPRRSPWRPGVLVPLGLAVAVVATYAGGTLLWP
ncbi:MAG: D-alanyl-D-alanine carboxypeptidase, partial [Microbacteriaceae bacterium]|nr:D-alanyl-D-alanine carboxypeptidase [Microbacteriaceae bacterium]